MDKITESRLLEVEYKAATTTTGANVHRMNNLLTVLRASKSACKDCSKPCGEDCEVHQLIWRTLRKFWEG